MTRFLAAMMLAFATTAQAQALSDAEVSALLADVGPGDRAGLVMSKFNIYCTGYVLRILSPTAAVLDLARQARTERRPFTLADVPAEVKAGNWRVFVFPDTPRKIPDARFCFGSVTHAVIRSKDDKTVLQPLTKTPFDGSVGNALGATLAYTGLDLTFDGASVAALIGDPKKPQPFLISVGKSDFEVKDKHFRFLLRVVP